MKNWTGRLHANDVARAIALAVTATVLVAAAPALAAPPTYTMTHLGSFGGNTLASALSNSGAVVGQGSLTAPPAAPDNRAFVFDGTSSRLLGGGPNSAAIGVNNTGKLVGTSPWSPVIVDFLANAVQPIGPDTSTIVPVAINDSGNVAGFATLSDVIVMAFLYDGTNGVYHALGTLGGNTSFALGINKFNQAAGLANTADGSLHAFLFSGSIMHDLGTLTGGVGEISAGTAINDSGHVAGTSTIGAFGRAFRYDGTTMHDLGALWASGDSYGYAINNSDVVVGASTIATGEQHAVLHDGTAMYDLNDLIDPSDPYKGHIVLNEAVGINDSGEIATNGCWAPPLNQHCFAFLLKPKVVAPPVASTGVVVKFVIGDINISPDEARARLIEELRP